MNTCDKHPVTKLEYEGEKCPYCAALAQWEAMSQAAVNIGTAFVKAALQGPVQISGPPTSCDPAAKIISYELNLLKTKLAGDTKITPIKSSLLI